MRNDTNYTEKPIHRMGEASIAQDRLHTSHSAYVATKTELDGAKIDGLLPPNFL